MAFKIQLWATPSGSALSSTQVAFSGTAYSGTAFWSFEISCLLVIQPLLAIQPFSDLVLIAILFSNECKNYEAQPS